MTAPQVLPPPTPWLTDRVSPWSAQAGREAVYAGIGTACSLGDLLAVTLLGGCALFAGLLLMGMALTAGGNDPVRTALAVCVAAPLWTWIGAGWARIAIAIGVDRLGSTRREPWSQSAGWFDDAAEGAAALAATPPLALLQLLVLSGPATFGVLAPGVAGAAAMALLALPLVVLGLVLPITTCALVVAARLPPLAAFALALRGLRRGWRSLLAVVLFHVFVGALVLACTAWIPGAVLLWLLWVPLQGAAGSVALMALALGWARRLAASAPPVPRWRAAPPPPSPGLARGAAALLRVSYGGALAAVAVALAVQGAGLPVSLIGVAAAVPFVPWAGGLLLLLHARTHHRAVALDDAGLLLDPGPGWPGTRVAWAEVRGAHVREGVVVLRMRWSEVAVVVPPEEVDPLLEWLAGHGVARAE